MPSTILHAADGVMISNTSPPALLLTVYESLAVLVFTRVAAGVGETTLRGWAGLRASVAGQRACSALYPQHHHLWRLFSVSGLGLWSSWFLFSVPFLFSFLIAAILAPLRSRNSSGHTLSNLRMGGASAGHIALAKGLVSPVTSCSKPPAVILSAAAYFAPAYSSARPAPRRGLT